MTGSQQNCRVILGTMTFGEHGVGSRVKNVEKVKEILDYFQKAGFKELDTARMYCEGNTEEVLGNIGVQKAPWNFKLATKVYPFISGDHEPAKLRNTFQTSLKALQESHVDIFYLHAPDHKTPLETTLEEVDRLYKEGKFTELGLSNYSSWQVAEIYHICRNRGFVMPTVYQGMYNLLTREVETELFPALAKFNIRFYAYNPLCGGMASGQYKIDDVKEDGSRFDPNVSQGKRYRERYWKGRYFESVEKIREACVPHGIAPAEAALRWLVHHSKINPRIASGGRDGILIGVSTLEHTKLNIKYSLEGPLPQDLVDLIDECWNHCQPACPHYFR
ncbi:hypothetical protein DSO57_1034273 [Entomophthora muscae]|uniref:Uncharacterized protein n=1 Tax=Entomophthora muscae TaxID=34485 RepID=A0ACC2SCU5_9FUNG|nr:hypothetical protein DSO57_1034273 [Entomophthora muscae]